MDLLYLNFYYVKKMQKLFSFSIILLSLNMTAQISFSESGDLQISGDVKRNIKQQKVFKTSSSPGIYEQILNANQSIISPGEEITVKHYFSGYGFINLDFNKIVFIPSADILEESYLTSGITVDKDNEFIWGGTTDKIMSGVAFVKPLNFIFSQTQIKFDTLRLNHLRDSLKLNSKDYIDILRSLDSFGIVEVDSLDINDKDGILFVNEYTNTYFNDLLSFSQGAIGAPNLPDNAKIEFKNIRFPRNIAINSESQLSGDQTTAPLIWHFKVREDTPPGKYNLNFLWTYHNGQEWINDKETIEITVMNWFERHNKCLRIIAIIVTIMSFISLIKPVVGFFGWFLGRKPPSSED
nr:hypothetical protein [Allomuricauda sp.]